MNYESTKLKVFTGILSDTSKAYYEALSDSKRLLKLYRVNPRLLDDAHEPESRCYATVQSGRVLRYNERKPNRRVHGQPDRTYARIPRPYFAQLHDIPRVS